MATSIYGVIGEINFPNEDSEDGKKVTGEDRLPLEKTTNQVLPKTTINLPDGWTEELVEKCTKADVVEVHLPVEPAGNENTQNGKFLAVQATESGLTLTLKIGKDCHEYVLSSCEKLRFIKEAGWDCMYFQHEDGYVVIHFTPKPS